MATQYEDDGADDGNFTYVPVGEGNTEDMNLQSLSYANFKEVSLAVSVVAKAGDKGLQVTELVKAAAEHLLALGGATEPKVLAMAFRGALFRVVMDNPEQDTFLISLTADVYPHVVACGMLVFLATSRVVRIHIIDPDYKPLGQFSRGYAIRRYAREKEPSGLSVYEMLASITTMARLSDAHGQWPPDGSAAPYPSSASGTKRSRTEQD